MNNKTVCLLIAFACLGNLFAQDNQPVIIRDTVYVTDTIHLRPVGFAGLGARRSDFDHLKTNKSFSVGIGSVEMYDTYLSPLQYKGLSVRLSYEQMRRTSWFKTRFHKQQVFDLELSSADNPAKNVTEYAAMLNYRIGGHYMFLRNKRNFRLGAGALWSTTGGILYNERNGNNPASAKVRSNIELSVIASYKWRKLAFRWQIDAPIAGVLFSPQYGQSYYEMSLGNTVGVAHFASLHNQRALRNYAAVDWAIGTYTIRVGYLGEFYQTKVNNLQTHHYTHSFVLGFPFESFKTKRPEAENSYWKCGW